MKANKKIVSIVWHQFLPANFGGQQTIAAFNKALANEVELICLCSHNNIIEEDVNYTIANYLPTSKWQFVNPIIWYKIYKFCKKNKPDYVLIEHGYHAISAWFIKHFLHIKIIHSSHNIEFERFKQLGKKYWKLIYWAEKWISQFAYINLFVTQEDKQKAIQLFALYEKKCLLLPHTIIVKNLSQKSISTQKIKTQHRIAADTKIFLFSGTLDYLPNAKAVENIATQLIPILQKTIQNFIFLVTGKIENKQYHYLHQFANKHLIITGNVNNIEDYFLTAQVFVNAVNIGGGVQTKTLEAISYNVNTVCFSNMLSGIETSLINNKLFIVENGNWQQMAEQIINAANKQTTTSSDFFHYYSYQNHLPKLLQML